MINQTKTACIIEILTGQKERDLRLCLYAAKLQNSPLTFCHKHSRSLVPAISEGCTDC